MSVPALPNLSNILALGLVINRSIDEGPTTVFTYPPDIPWSPATTAVAAGGSGPAATHSTDNARVETEDLLVEKIFQPDLEVAHAHTAKTTSSSTSSSTNAATAPPSASSHTHSSAANSSTASSSTNPANAGSTNITNSSSSSSSSAAASLARHPDRHGSLSHHHSHHHPHLALHHAHNNNRHQSSHGQSPHGHGHRDGGEKVAPWDTFAGIPSRDLASLLSPSRAYHQRLFHLSMDSLHFVSCPIHVPENGSWRKRSKREKRRRRKARQSLRSDHKSASTKDVVFERGGGAAPTSTTNMDGVPDTDSDQDIDHDSDWDEEHRESRDHGRGPKKKEQRGPDSTSSMTMFNIVFVLRPKKMDVNELVTILHQHILKKMARAFKYTQQRSDFVWEESRKILELMEKAREEYKPTHVLWKEIMAASSLATAIYDVYMAISRNKIATLSLETAHGTLSPSLQIPVPYYLSDIPHNSSQNQASPQKGIWLTTAYTPLFGNDSSNNNDDRISDFVDKNFALLLTTSSKAIIAELQRDSDPTTLAMVEFARLAQPTISFKQLAQHSSLSLDDVRRFAQHFIFWRRAIAIPPLHFRHTYIVSPNADLSRLPAATKDWSRIFPRAPALPDFLAELSLSPRPYKVFCRSKNYRPMYLNMLAYLVRKGWITQLNTFAYVIVWPEILYEVDYALEEEEVRAAQESAASAAVEGASSPPPPSAVVPEISTAHHHHEAQRSQSSNSMTTEESTSPTTASTEGNSFPPQNSLLTQTFLPTIRSQDETKDDGQDTHPEAPDDAGKDTLPVPATTAPKYIISSAPGLSQHHPPTPASPVPSSSTVQQDASVTPGAQPQQPDWDENRAEQARLLRVADKAKNDTAEKASAHSRKPLPTRTDSPSTNQAPHLREYYTQPYIILDPSKASGKESLYLDAIQARLNNPSRCPPPGQDQAEWQAQMAGQAQTQAQAQAQAQATNTLSNSVPLDPSQEQPTLPSRTRHGFFFTRYGNDTATGKSNVSTPGLMTTNNAHPLSGTFPPPEAIHTDSADKIQDAPYSVTSTPLTTPKKKPFAHASLTLPNASPRLAGLPHQTNTPTTGSGGHISTSAVTSQHSSAAASPSLYAAQPTQPPPSTLSALPPSASATPLNSRQSSGSHGMDTKASQTSQIDGPADGKTTTSEQTSYGNDQIHAQPDAYVTAVGQAWPRFLRYFNGKIAMEQIAALEEMKHREVWALLNEMKEYMLCVRHW